MTLTRTPACTVRGCPAPRDPDWHVPWCGHGLEGHHHHVIKRSQGGKDGIQVFICPKCHDNIDNGEWGNDVTELSGRGLVYWAWDIHGNTVIEREVLSDGAEAGIAPPQGADEAPTSTPSAPSLSTKEESDGAQNVSVLPDGGRDKPVCGDSHIDSPSSPLTHEQRVAVAQDIKDTEWNRQWFAGDIGNLWIEQLGESAEQYLSDFGYQPESLANILRVCAKIPPAYRNGNLRFSHHVVVAGENLEDIEMHLAECEENEWSVAEFRRQRKGTKPRVKRWNRPELQERWDGFWYYRDQIDPEWDTNSHINIAFAKFLDWLSAEEQA